MLEHFGQHRWPPGVSSKQQGKSYSYGAPSNHWPKHHQLDQQAEEDFEFEDFFMRILALRVHSSHLEHFSIASLLAFVLVPKTISVAHNFPAPRDSSTIFLLCSIVLLSSQFEWVRYFPAFFDILIVLRCVLLSLSSMRGESRIVLNQQITTQLRYPPPRIMLRSKPGEGIIEVVHSPPRSHAKRAHMMTTQGTLTSRYSNNVDHIISKIVIM